MKKSMAVSICAVLVLVLLAGCQSEPAVPYVTGEGVQSGQLTPGNTTPQDDQQAAADQTTGEDPSTQGSQQTTKPADPTQQTTTAPTQGQQTTRPTQSQQGGQQSTQPTQGQQTTQPTQGQQGGQTQTEPTEFVLPTPDACTYEQYMAMTGEQQEQFFNQFNGDFEAFFAWLDNAKAESDANSGDIVVEPDTTIDLDSLIGTEG